MSSEWWGEPVDDGGGDRVSWNILPQSLKGLFVVTIRDPVHSGGYHLEEQVGPR